MSNDPLLTVNQLAEREGVPAWKVRDWLRKGLPHYTACGIRIRYSQFVAWLEARSSTQTSIVA